MPYVSRKVAFVTKVSLVSTALLKSALKTAPTLENALQGCASAALNSVALIVHWIGFSYSVLGIV